jgi:hypothetical protein
MALLPVLNNQDPLKGTLILTASCVQLWWEGLSSSHRAFSARRAQSTDESDPKDRAPSTFFPYIDIADDLLDGFRIVDPGRRPSEVIEEQSPDLGIEFLDEIQVPHLIDYRRAAFDQAVDPSFDCRIQGDKILIFWYRWQARRPRPDPESRAAWRSLSGRCRRSPHYRRDHADF